MKYSEAQAALESGKINGFTTGERVFAKREAWLVSSNGQTARRIDKGLHLIAKTFSRTGFGFQLDGEEWHGDRKDFGTFPDGKVVLSTF